jgi:acyl-CoA synthetase (NDP forming)
MGASGGDMAMTADVARNLDLDFATIPSIQAASLRELLTDRVTVANPLDVHTYLWFDPPAMGRVFSTALRSGYDAVGFMLDCPPEDQADGSSYHAVIDEFIAAAQPKSDTDKPSRAALIGSLPETVSPQIRARCYAKNVMPLQGQREALEGLSLAGGVGIAWRTEPAVELYRPAATPTEASAYTLTEAEGKQALAAYGVRVPQGQVVAASDVAATPPPSASPSSSKQWVPGSSTRPKWAESFSTSAPQPKQR